MSGSASHVACLLMPPILLSMGDCRTCDILPCIEQPEGHEAAMGTGSVLVDDSTKVPLIKRATLLFKRGHTRAPTQSLPLWASSKRSLMGEGPSAGVNSA